MIKLVKGGVVTVIAMPEWFEYLGVIVINDVNAIGFMLGNGLIYRSVVFHGHGNEQGFEGDLHHPGGNKRFDLLVYSGGDNKKPRRNSADSVFGGGGCVHRSAPKKSIVSQVNSRYNKREVFLLQLLSSGRNM